MAYLSQYALDFNKNWWNQNVIFMALIRYKPQNVPRFCGQKRFLQKLKNAHFLGGREKKSVLKLNSADKKISALLLLVGS